MGARGVAEQMLGVATEDTITVNVQWANSDGSVGVRRHAHALPSSRPLTAQRTVPQTSSHTSSWIAPPSDVHSKQRFFFMGQRGQVEVNQVRQGHCRRAHCASPANTLRAVDTARCCPVQAQRGYTADTDEAGHKSVNPLYMRYTPKAGKFVGQQGYGYQAIAAFVDAVLDIRAGRRKPQDFDDELPTVGTAGAGVGWCWGWDWAELRTPPLPVCWPLVALVTVPARPSQPTRS